MKHRLYFCLCKCSLTCCVPPVDVFVPDSSSLFCIYLKYTQLFVFISFCLSLTGYDARTMSLTGYDTRICVAQKMAQGSWVRRSVSVPFGPFEKMMACYLLELMQSSFYGTPLKYFFFCQICRIWTQ